MKMKLCLIFAISAIFVNKLNAKTTNVNSFDIVSDIKKDSLAVGTCVIKGKIIEFISKSNVANAYVSTTNFIRYSFTNEVGEYELVISEKDSMIFFYHESYGEIVVSNFDFKSQHEVTINFYTDAPKPIKIMVEKPVIYLYADAPLDVELTLVPRGDFIFTYPLYNDGWKVKVLGKGQIEVNHKDYPYLFWESKQENLNFLHDSNGSVEGYFINTDSTILFLENKLQSLGLNATEMTDFITYWAPRLIKKPFATVQFIIDEDYDREIGQLKSSIKPDSQRRIFMIFKGSDFSTSPNFLVEPTWNKFERSGFTRIEWGGAEF